MRDKHQPHFGSGIMTTYHAMVATTGSQPGEIVEWYFVVVQVAQGQDDSNRGMACSRAESIEDLDSSTVFLQELF